MTDDVEREVRDSYSDAAASWAVGPSLVYGLLADALVGCIADDLSGALVLDLGAGTGVASAALMRAGARVVAADVAYGMLRHDAASRPPAVCADAAGMPFPDATFDHLAAAFVLNHVPDLVGALVECRRAVRTGGAIVASTFSAARQHPAKAAIDAVVTEAGFVPPDWFAAFKAEREPQSGSVDALRGAAADAGLTGVVVHDLDVDITSVGADGLSAYRLGMAQVLPFLDSLDRSQRAEVHRAAVNTAAPYLSAPMPMLALVARVQG